MRNKIFLLTIGFCLSVIPAISQPQPGMAEVDAQSFALYEKAEWKTLLVYCREAIAKGIDFPYLRLRAGYAAMMTEHYGEALKHYDVVLKNDKYQSTAHFYSWLCLRYMNQDALADMHRPYFPADWKKGTNAKNVAITSAGMETSAKFTDNTRRGDGIYTRISLGNRWSKNVHMEQSIALYNQTVNEPTFTTVVNNASIKINQKEYYNLLTLNLNFRWQFKAAYHYAYTPFNNFAFNNHVGLFGIRYQGNKAAFQASYIAARMSDINQSQVNIQADWYPMGNLNFYILSTGMYRNRSSENGFNLKEVIGFRMMKKLWLEGNATFGSFSNLLENDALYIYNAIDKNQFKGGATAYFSVGKRVTAQAGYTYEKRELLNTNFTFNQHSITGGLSWKF